MPAFASVDRTLQAFMGSSFAPYAFAGRTFEREPPAEADSDASRPSGLTRTLRLDERGARTLVHVRSSQLAFRQAASAALVRAGYTLETTCARESVYRRWLSLDAIGAEVSLLETLDRASLALIPSRGPMPYRARIEDEHVARGLFHVRAAATTWDECSLALEHKLDLVGACGAYHVVIAALALEGVGDRTFESYVGIASRSPGRSVSSDLCGVLERAGYVRVGSRENSGFLCANRRFSSADALAAGSLEIVTSVREGASARFARSRV